MQKSKFINLLVVFLALVCLISCEYDTIENEKIVIPPNQEISFASDIVPILNTKCVQCHDGGIKPDLKAENAYNTLINGAYIDKDIPSNSKLYQILQEGSHSTRASATEKQQILEWIKRGANNN